ncbi:MAG: hypothetical protein H0V66_04865 [Bdellovibrionales bacterium]|nr:hypothetical protein [Bdellovibrionales bacterium]
MPDPIDELIEEILELLQTHALRSDNSDFAKFYNLLVLGDDTVESLQKAMEAANRSNDGFFHLILAHRLLGHSYENESYEKLFQEKSLQHINLIFKSKGYNETEKKIRKRLLKLGLQSPKKFKIAFMLMNDFDFIDLSTPLGSIFENTISSLDENHPNLGLRKQGLEYSKMMLDKI